MAEKSVQSNKLVKAHARNLRISPRKLRLLTNLVKQKNAEQALMQLQFANKKGADMVTKLLQSALANARNNFSMDPARMFIKSITADMGPVLKRSFPRARGSAFLIRRKLSHLSVVLEEAALPKKSVPVKKAAAKTKATPVKTKEGTVGLPKESSKKITRGSKASEVHHENESSKRAQETSNQNLVK